jgi:hypothetical protein
MGLGFEENGFDDEKVVQAQAEFCRWVEGLSFHVQQQQEHQKADNLNHSIWRPEGGAFDWAGVVVSSNLDDESGILTVQVILQGVSKVLPDPNDKGTLTTAYGHDESVTPPLASCVLETTGQTATTPSPTRQGQTYETSDLNSKINFPEPLGDREQCKAVHALPLEIQSMIQNMRLQPNPQVLYMGPSLTLTAFNPGAMDLWGFTNGAEEGRVGIILPSLKRVFEEGEAVVLENIAVDVWRDGTQRETYHNISIIPVVDFSKQTTGVLVSTSESTAEVIYRRHIEYLLSAKDNLCLCPTLDSYWSTLIDALRNPVRDISFSVM